MKRIIVHPMGDRMALVDGREVIAAGRRIPSGGWLLTLRSGCWIDPEARVASPVTGKADPSRWLVKDKSKAMKELRLLSRRGA